MTSGTPSSSRSWSAGPAQSHCPRARFDAVVHRTSQPLARWVNATRPPRLCAATISGVASSPPRSPIATGAEAITVGDAIVARWAQVGPSITRSTPENRGSPPVHDSGPWSSVPLYDGNTIDVVVGSSSVATIGVASTLTCAGNGSPAGGPDHAHCTV